jgi:hypothetical protein
MAREVRKLSSVELMEQLRQLEQERSMTPQEFYERFRAGELDDSPETMRWAGLCYMAERSGLLTAPAVHA